MGFRKASEAGVQKTCIEVLKLRGFFVIRVNSGAVRIPATATARERFVRMNSAAGCSDCLCVAPDGVFVAIEFKRPGKKPRENQEEFLAEVRRRNGLAIVADSLESLQAALKAEGYDV